MLICARSEQLYRVRDDCVMRPAEDEVDMGWKSGSDKRNELTGKISERLADERCETVA